LLDLVGLAAATAHRGVRHAFHDNLKPGRFRRRREERDERVRKKNFIGTFAVPWAVINDFDLLASLTPRDRRAGYIEAVKVACIRDAAFLKRRTRRAPSPAVQAEASAADPSLCQLHVNHIATSGDPFELGSARPLDFGHWTAHKLEQISDYKIRHGRRSPLASRLT
jgi:3-dehydroquinate synthase